MHEVAGLVSEEVKALHAFAEQIADQTKALILDLWMGAEIHTQLKEDRTPVTQVDLQAEKLARELIQRQYPEHGVIGEEFEPLNPESDYQWTIDPIDGTQNLVNRIPTFGTLIGLRYKNQAVLGVIDHPVLNLRSSGGCGIGVTVNGERVQLTDLLEARLSDSDIIATNNIGVFGETDAGRALFHRIIATHPHSRIYYDCYAHSLAVSGSLAVVVEPNLKIWDLTPVEALLTECGGRFEYFNPQADKGHVTLYNAVFGKPKAVERMLEHIR